MLLGCIGDDFTGSSDLANTLARSGMRVVQFNGVPGGAADSDAEAAVVALKSRTIAPGEAVAQSLAALEWLKRQGCRQFFFKYCSTFDSTRQGNIGPVLDALSAALDADRVAVCPAFPATGRTIYQGHLFVGDRLLNESGMENHPLTPMPDADIRRWLGQQTGRGIGHVPHDVVARGATAVDKAMAEHAAGGRPYVIIDALSDADLMAIGGAVAGHSLVSGGSGVALGLPGNFRQQGLLSQNAMRWQGGEGAVAALCGSCSSASRRQIAYHSASQPARCLAVEDVFAATASPDEFVDWVMRNQGEGIVPLIYSSAEPAAVATAQETYGRERVADAIEHFFSQLAVRLVQAGARRLIVAGGETSGAVVSALEIPAFEIGPEIDPGVPALKTVGGELSLALKSGNFGGEDFFARAGDVLKRTEG